MRGCYKGFAPFCATLSVKDPSVRSGEFLSRWRIFIADEIFYRRIFHRWGAGLFLCPLGIWGGPGFSGISGGYGARRAVGFALSGLWGGGGVLVGCVQTRVLGAHASPFELYSAAKLQ